MRSRPLSLLVSLPLLVPYAAADLGGPNGPVHLQVHRAAAGTVSRIALRTGHLGRPAFLLYGGSPGPIVLGQASLPVLHVGPPLGYLTGATGTNGILDLAVPLPASLPAGLAIHLQGAVAAGPGQVLASEGRRVIVGGPAATFTDLSGTLDPSTALFEAAEVDWIDIDRDGYADVLVANEGPGARPLLLVADGAGAHADEAPLRLPAAALAPASCVEAGDVDGDGDPDLFLGGGLDSAAPAPNLLLRNDGAGIFSLDPLFPPGSGWALSAEFGDVDGDGDADLLVANQQDASHPGESPDPTVLYVNQGGQQGGSQGTFVADATFAAMAGNDPHTDSGEALLGDVDDDGDLDVFVIGSNLGGTPPGHQNRLYRNDGPAGFTDVTATALPDLPDDSFAAKLADFDGDGYLDLFVANTHSSQPVAGDLLLNRGAAGPGTFVDGTANLPSSFGPVSGIRVAVDAGDVEGDGDVDLVVGIHELPFGPFPMTAGASVLLLNRGGIQGGVFGTFELDPLFAPGTFIPADVALGDADGDGDLDVWFANKGDIYGLGAPQDHLLRNDL